MTFQNRQLMYDCGGNITIMKSYKAERTKIKNKCNKNKIICYIVQFGLQGESLYIYI